MRGTKVVCSELTVVGYNIQTSAERELDETHRTSLLESVTNLDDLGEGVGDYVTLATWKGTIFSLAVLTCSRKMGWKNYSSKDYLFCFNATLATITLNNPKCLYLEQVCIPSKSTHVRFRLVNSITPITAPLVVFLAFQKFDVTVPISNIEFPVYGLCMLIGLVLTIILFFTSKWDETPIYFPVRSLHPFFEVVLTVISFIVLLHLGSRWHGSTLLQVSLLLSFRQLDLSWEYQMSS